MNRSIVLVAALVACTPEQRQDAKTVLDVVKVTCIIANQALSDTEIASVCDVVGPYLSPMRDVLASARDTTARTMRAARAVPCRTTSDGGTP